MQAVAPYSVVLWSGKGWVGGDIELAVPSIERRLAAWGTGSGGVGSAVFGLCHDRPRVRLWLLILVSSFLPCASFIQRV